jgi:hypothetical protein
MPELGRTAILIPPENAQVNSHTHHPCKRELRRDVIDVGVSHMPGASTHQERGTRTSIPETGRSQNARGNPYEDSNHQKKPVVHARRKIIIFFVVHSA